MSASGFSSSAWPTPTANDFKGSGPTLIRQDGKIRGDRLDYAAEQFWATPRSEMARALGNPKHICGSRGKGNLEDQVVAWPAPDLPPSLPVLTTVKTGGESSKERRSLNPLFVEWLMGWPPGWTLIHETRLVSIGLGSSATALSRFRRDMRSALFALALHDAPPEQPSLFG
jgi:hypothetical protein